jgi:hypothetical protein
VPLGNCHFGEFAVSSLVAGAKKRKEERKERNKTYSFLFRICNL